MYTFPYKKAVAFSDCGWQLVNDGWLWKRRGGGGGMTRGGAGGEGPPWGSACGSEHDKGTPEWLSRGAKGGEKSRYVTILLGAPDMRQEMSTSVPRIPTAKLTKIIPCCLFEWFACKYELCFHSCYSLYKVLAGDAQAVIGGAINPDA